jgi:hypothetical protein
MVAYGISAEKIHFSIRLCRTDIDCNENCFFSICLYYIIISVKSVHIVRLHPCSIRAGIDYHENCLFAAFAYTIL